MFCCTSPCHRVRRHRRYPWDLFDQKAVQHPVVRRFYTCAIPQMWWLGVIWALSNLNCQLLLKFCVTLCADTAMQAKVSAAKNLFFMLFCLKYGCIMPVNFSQSHEGTKLYTDELCKTWNNSFYVLYCIPKKLFVYYEVQSRFLRALIH